MIMVSLPLQQTSDPSYPDILLIAINRHGLLLIHPKTKVGLQGLRRQHSRHPIWGGMPAFLPAPPQRPSLLSIASLSPGSTKHLLLHQDLQLE